MRSEELFKKAEKLIPGGVSSPVRAIKPYPFYTESGKGGRIRTADETELIDCCLGYGPLILGHAHDAIKAAIQKQLDRGWLYGTPTEQEIEMAERIIRDQPGIEMVRSVSSGSEATMAAIRLARGYTGKKKILKIEGGFHGAHDSVLIKAGSGATTLGIPDSAGIPPGVAEFTRQVPYNDPVALDQILAGDDDIAAFILEPVMGNIGPILPEEHYLKEVRRITQEHDVLLIFDEVITGYRLGIGGAAKKYGITPDLTTLGKIIGGGLPIGAFGGRRDIMEMIAPAGPVYQAGTFSGNPLSLAAGIATIDYLNTHQEEYRRAEERTRAIEDSLPSSAKGSFVRTQSIFKYFFRDNPPKNYAEAKESDTDTFRTFWKAALQNGVFIPPAQFESNFLSFAHTDEDIETIAGVYHSCLP
ncbi:MAG: Glutamate-1-semialdehyde 2,1-aminomutase [Methanomicrobiales archaeon 53_19]|uniref:glutamate-1-semialdehyde 2,1-aminomutase n=1 Tax=Methanocalculus sp. TaxID=2004547 RepID=UPI00074AE965|nr:glutamate-1-semialdehyde 2,1-aminomutase [Methanocalculus sp.]KUK71210.1 MAG: Glutamate-1-semialdehyde 2,1-aminomutase [Methanocalculus sp. 52_23]KUL04753.1 MAG: Glutamate-1-semialdehyde 2,1-aminomutase [Methanomicrobiales archaeon 53_19]HIJ06969.1 glutamate-1-semialdehyde 2,1-aminomutase [Methanocalculus sp.]